MHFIYGEYDFIKNAESGSFRVLAVDDEEPVLKIYSDVLLKKSDNKEEFSEIPE